MVFLCYFYINMMTRCSLYSIRMSLLLASTAIISQNGGLYAIAIDDWGSDSRV